ncbi:MULTISPECIES: TonB-dependent receptor [Acinetobacter]|uniref:TonB-dependent receptor n=1 Tax=Acinetobacter TaxID=469 RepID=UPI00143C8C77|nr:MULTISPECIES: TonB-dependent receptor [Acinetobacter]MDD0801296.1 TonB-dependent receptor [Acinetobacter sp. Gutcm_16]NKG38934.1 TonB-dependent siderophore receptor [Acinetobacter johnsonii]
MNRFMLPMQLTCLTLAVCTQLYAQDNVVTNSASQTSSVEAQQKETTQLAPIVVTATRSAKSIADIAGTVYSIDQAEIEKQANAGRSTADIIGFLIPSLTPSSGTTSNYGMTMRGRAVQYMIDGVPQTGSRDSSRQLNSISPNSIERIEVVSGASSIYGAGATGGIINIITKKGSDDALSFESKLGVTSGDNIRSDAMAYEAFQSVAFNQGNVSGYLGASYNKRGEFQDSHGDRIGPEVAQTDRQDTETVDVNGRLSWQFTDNQKLSFGAQYYNDEQDSEYGPDYGTGLAVLFGAEPTLNAVKGLDLDTQPRTKRSNFNLQYEHQDVLGQILNAEAYYRSETGRFYPSANYLAHSAIPSGGTYIVTQSETDIDVWGARLALQKAFDLGSRSLNLTYGMDYDFEQGSQTAQQYNLGTFMASNGLTLDPQNEYAFGPDVDTSKFGLFLQTQFDVTDHLNLQAGIRHERIDSEVQDSIPYSEAMVADAIPTYTPVALNGGTIKHDATLFNLGAVYHLTDAQQVFANFSQGSSLPDIQRMLRDVPASFTVNSQTIDPIKVNNYELGWRVQAENGLNASVTTFYNDSDKSLKFGRPNYTIEVLDTDERVYGVEGNLSYRLQPNWTVGGTMAYTRGQFKNTAGKWQELDAIRVAPLKGTAFSEWQFNNDMSLRVQALAIGGTDKAKKDAVKYGSTVPAEIKGFATMDVIANAKAGPGTVGFGVYNVWNTDYKSVYSQAVESVYGAISSLPAQGRTYGLSYTLKY